jgi:hypothetical protein
MKDRTANLVLRVIGQSLKLEIGLVRVRAEGGSPAIIVAARDQDGQVYRARAENIGDAVEAFAEMVGFDLRDG